MYWHLIAELLQRGEGWREVDQRVDQRKKAIAKGQGEGVERGGQCGRVDADVRKDGFSIRCLDISWLASISVHVRTHVGRYDNKREGGRVIWLGDVT
jgi:hypothetical protein